ncbi:MAG: methyl-accepting chemotaxis protein [Undibacterium sp.]|nr:methyl-accepting chemotaxis protein [Undibacterium sp.]
MRNNLPITQNEYAFPPGMTLVSVTDLKGRITYCNPAFAKVSGFQSEELIGQSHNIVRHPGMPEEAFRDMWETIQAGLPWSGIVKNRRKNGDYYWVMANATPMLEGDRITGFLSVRSEPDKQAVKVAEHLYGMMQEEKKQGRLVHVLKRGQVMRTDFFGRIARLMTPETSGKLIWIQLATVGVAASMAKLGWSIELTALSILGVAAIGYLATKRLLIKPLHQLVSDANRMASGDLSNDIEINATGMVGQVQQALKQMSLNLRTVVHDVRAEVINLSIGIQEIASGNQDLSSRTESQASSLQETAASMEEINTSVQHSSTVAAQGAVLAHTASDVTQEGNRAVDAIAESMADITDSSKKIGEMNSLIEDVAFQTNILALNAAVEAAHAGNQGRGFAVVAAEVRALAARASDAARSIKLLITQAGDNTQQGNRRTENASEHLHHAITSVDQVSSVLDQINYAANEQKLGISQINQAVASMDALTQQNAALVEQLAAAAQSLQFQSESVNNSMRLFRLKRGEVTLSQLDAVQMRREAKDYLRLN